jgi:hypothetical protein
LQPAGRRRRAFPKLAHGDANAGGTYGHSQFNEHIQGAKVVFGSREKAGFGGMITVSVVLLAMQIITGVQAFPL